LVPHRLEPPRNPATTPFCFARVGALAFLVLCNRLVAISMAVGMSLWRGERMRPIAPLRSYATVALTNFVATYCQYEGTRRHAGGVGVVRASLTPRRLAPLGRPPFAALKYVSFPTQTLGKCGKVIPVMVIGTVMDKKNYTARDYAVAAVLVAGSFLFLTTGVRRQRRPPPRRWRTVADLPSHPLRSVVVADHPSQARRGVRLGLRLDADGGLPAGRRPDVDDAGAHVPRLRDVDLQPDALHQHLLGRPEHPR